jgi:hypothetical protein
MAGSTVQIPREHASAVAQALEAEANRYERLARDSSYAGPYKAHHRIELRDKSAMLREQSRAIKAQLQTRGTT